ncbi:MAG: acetyl-CoA carboxylase biotin carboxylase subunit [Chloroflexi bacterium]|nr:acetyl-CoA carboxylase biotin carboxylase subunit [Chloroflexota bacterium]
MLTAFRKVLVANRGEIAVRVLRACAELGLATVAVYSDIDRHALHVRYADEAYPIGSAPASESYLRIDRLIDVARESGAEAIHPGYGFLAENPDFSQACRDAGLTFIGPSPHAIRTMGDKLLARKTVSAAGVPIVPGSDGIVPTQAAAEAVARAIGYPLLLKAAAGGGGKGMRVVRAPEELAGAYRAAASEALAAFGDDRLYVERLLESVRHIEVQVLADRHGNVIHLGERECSIQRRHQKLIEESPSTVVDDDLRHAMGAIAVRAAQAAGYENAGTAEFLLDRDKHYYFLEMNTRLQVEHPVTEMVTGIDLVVEQLRIAMGRRLRYRQKDVRPNGWAIECRITAEDPYNNFLPSTGRLTSVDEPSGPGVRVDSGMFEGMDVSVHYDPLLAKLICWGETRGQAILRMRRALNEFHIMGIKTVVPFHLRVMDSPSFIAGRFDTAFMEKQAVLTERESERGLIAAVAAAAVAYRAKQEAAARAMGQSAPDARGPGSTWRVVARREGLR